MSGDSFDLIELQALPLARCNEEDVSGLPGGYLARFLAPRINEDGTALLCIGCGGALYRPGVMGALLGSTFVWGLAHGEGYCCDCGYPARMYHEIEGLHATFPLQYHPDELIKAEGQP